MDYAGDLIQHLFADLGIKNSFVCMSNSYITSC